MTRQHASWLLVLVLSLAACTRGRDRSRSSDDDSVRSTATSAPSSPRSPAASDVRSASATPARSIDLLHRTASVVVTSSHADGNSTGAYLVDQLPETSWQPNPPDRTPWVEVDLPAPASIERIELTPVQPSTGSARPLEPRLEAARLLVPGPGARWEPHPVRRSISDSSQLLFEPDAPANFSRLRLTLTGAPRGLRVAELRVMGAIGHDELLGPALPETQVQGNARVDYSGDLFASWVLGAPYAGEDALCQAFIRLLALDAANSPQPPCRALPDITVAGAAPPELRSVQRYLLTIPDQVSPMETTALVVRAERGLYPANVALTDSRNDGMCPGGPEGDMQVSNFRFEHGVLLIDRTRYFAPGTLQQETPQPPPAAAASILRCRFEGRLSCREFITHFGPPTAILDENGVPYGVKLPTTWDWTRTVEITRRGSVRLTPCRTADRKDGRGTIVPCATPGAEVL